jgi:hypothetical protein
MDPSQSQTVYNRQKTEDCIARTKAAIACSYALLERVRLRKELADEVWWRLREKSPTADWR